MSRIIITFLLLIFHYQGFCQKPFAVVELFTSEGCSSCPPADALVNKTSKATEKEGKNVFYLVYHVDYWNRLGWKDPYSKFQFTQRQETYSRVLSGKEVYTPQVIINGENGFVGSNANKLNEGINDALSTTAKIFVTAAKDSIVNDTLYITYKTTNPGSNYFLRFALTESGLVNEVTKGENKGKTLHHDHVVRYFSSIDKILPEGVSKIPLRGLKLSSKHELVFFIQNKQSMKIVSAGKIEF